MELQEIILTQRNALNMSQAELAEASGLSIRTIQRIEKGEVQARPYTRRVILQTLGIQNEQIEVSSTKEEGISASAQVQLNKFIFAHMSLLVLPCLYLFLVFFLRKRFDRSKLLDELFTKILSVQLIWNFLALMILFFSPMWFGQVSIGRMPTFMIAYYLWTIPNLMFLLWVGYQASKKTSHLLAYIPRVL